MNEEKLSPPVAHAELLDMTSKVVSAYLSKNDIPAAQITDVIATVYGSLKDLGAPQPEVVSEPQRPAVPVKKSVFPDYIICLEDGKKLKMLKRHLRTMYNMTPEEYRAKWNLGPDYPMVAPNYAAQRSEFAKQIGLGKGSAKDRPRRGRRPAVAAGAE
jgi:predicted transcriptional regulator